MAGIDDNRPEWWVSKGSLEPAKETVTERAESMAQSEYLRTWFELGGGVIRIEEIAAVTRYWDETPSGLRGVAPRRSPAKRGLHVTLKSGAVVDCPDALWEDVQLTLMAAGVLSCK